MQRVPLGVRFGLFPAPSLPHGHCQRPSLISAGMSQQPPQLSPAGFSADFTEFDQQQAYVGSLNERHVRRRRVDDGQHPSRPSAHQQHMVGILPQHHHQDQAQAHWHVQQAIVAATPMRPDHGYLLTYTTPTIHHYSHANAPTQHAMPNPAAHPHSTSGGSQQGQGRFDYNSGHAAYPQSAQMQAYQPYSSPALATPLQAIFPLVNKSSSHVSPHLAEGNPTAPNETHNSGVEPSGSDIDIGGASTSGYPTPPSQRTRTRTNRSDRTFKGPDPTLSKRPADLAVRKSRPVGYEGDLVLLQQRCRKQGADEGAIELLAKVFVDGVSLEALTRPLTNSAMETVEFGVSTGKVYTAFLAPTEEEEGVAPRYVCRLCDGGQAWKHSKDVLRHLRRDHFGLARVCKKCSEKFYTKGEMTRHPCKPIKRTRLTGSA